MSKKNVLVLGGAGFIASNLIEELIKRKDVERIYSYDDYSTGKKSNHIDSKKILYLRGSTKNINTNIKLKNINLDHVYHFAEFSRIVPSFPNIDICWKSNTEGTYQVLKFCLSKKVKLIYSGSSSTIGDNKYLSPYSWTKYCNNELIKNFNKWYGLNYVIVYFYNVYGGRQLKKSPMSALMGIFEEQYKNNKPLTVVKPGDQVRDFTHVKDIVQGTILAAYKSNNDEFHLGSGKNYSILEIAKMFKHDYVFVPERRGERFYSLSKNTKAKRILGYKPKNNIKEYINDYKKSILDDK
jgi:UDP-glucose 4-epimerase